MTVDSKVPMLDVLAAIAVEFAPAAVVLAAAELVLAAMDVA